MTLWKVTRATPLRLIFLGNIGFIATLELAMAPWTSNWNDVSSFLLLNFTLGAAAGFSGGLLGFIFGVPRAPEATDRPNKSYRANTNLEQISDWLTKLLVGATLASLGSIPSFAIRFVDFLNNHGYRGLPGEGTLALFILIYYLALGFLWSYIETRAYIGQWLDGDPQSEESMKEWATQVYAKLRAGASVDEAVKFVIPIPTPTAPDPKCVASKLSDIKDPSVDDIQRAISECMTKQ
jgi:hypothetical protein